MIKREKPYTGKGVLVSGTGLVPGDYILWAQNIGDVELAFTGLVVTASKKTDQNSQYITTITHKGELFPGHVLDDDVLKVIEWRHMGWMPE